MAALLFGVFLVALLVGIPVAFAYYAGGYGCYDCR